MRICSNLLSDSNQYAPQHAQFHPLKGSKNLVRFLLVIELGVFHLTMHPLSQASYLPSKPELCNSSRTWGCWRPVDPIDAGKSTTSIPKCYHTKNMACQCHCQTHHEFCCIILAKMLVGRFLAIQNEDAPKWLHLVVISYDWQWLTFMELRTLSLFHSNEIWHHGHPVSSWKSWSWFSALDVWYLNSKVANHVPTNMVFQRIQPTPALAILLLSQTAMK